MTVLTKDLEQFLYVGFPSSLARWAVNTEVWLSYILVRKTYVNGLGQQIDDAAEHGAQRLVEGAVCWDDQTL